MSATSIKRFALSLLSLLWVSAALAADGPPFDFRADLAVLHPEIAASESFKAWGGPSQLNRWGESPRDASGEQTVFLQKEGSITSATTRALLLKYSLSGKTDIVQTKDYTKAQVSASFGIAKAKMLQEGFSIADFSAVTPLPDPAAGTLGWQIDLEGRTDKRYKVSPEGLAIELSPLTAPASAHDCAAGGDDTTSANDLHHPADADILTAAQVPGSTPIQDIAIRLCNRVFNDIAYQMVGLADVFTDSDSITRQRGFGVCDEKAVVLVSYLRANHIPARMKFLRWRRKGVEQAHACVEYYDSDSAAWLHLDPTWNVHDRGVYRSVKVDGELLTDIRVVDVDWPDDARSPSPLTAQVPDPNDGRLNPWADFCYSPSIEGEPRPGYSFP